MSAELKERLEKHEFRSPDDKRFVERLLELTREIERGFDGDERARLLRLAEAAFERHLALRGHTCNMREALERLRDDQQRLMRILEALRARPEGETVH